MKTYCMEKENPCKVTPNKLVHHKLPTTQVYQQSHAYRKSPYSKTVTQSYITGFHTAIFATSIGASKRW